MHLIWDQKIKRNNQHDLFDSVSIDFKKYYPILFTVLLQKLYPNISLRYSNNYLIVTTKVQIFTTYIYIKYLH